LNAQNTAILIVYAFPLINVIMLFWSRAIKIRANILGIASIQPVSLEV